MLFPTTEGDANVAVCNDAQRCELATASISFIFVGIAATASVGGILGMQVTRHYEARRPMLPSTHE